MPPAALALVLGAALAHSLWNLILKIERGRLDVGFLALGVGVIVSAPVLFVYPLGEVPAAGWALIALSAAFETGYFLALSAAYQVGDLSLVYPIARGTAPLVVAPLAIALLGERPSWPGLAGIALVVVGIFGSHAVDLRSWSTSAANRRALAWAFLTGLMTSGYSLVNKLGVELVAVPLYAFLVFLLDTAMIYLALWRRGQVPLGHGGPRQAPQTPRALAHAPGDPGRGSGSGVTIGPVAAPVLVGVLMIAAYLAVLAAMSLAPVSYVVAAREVSIVIAPALGALVLGERHPMIRIVGAVVIFAGLVLIALGR